MMIALDVKITNIIPKVTKSLLLGLVAMTKYLNGTRKRGGGGAVCSISGTCTSTMSTTYRFFYTLILQGRAVCLTNSGNPYIKTK